MEKYSPDVKMEIVNEWKSTKGLRSDVCKKYGVPKQTIRKWVKLYDAYGMEGLISSPIRTTYTGEFKQTVIEDMRNNNLSQSEVSLRYHVGRTQIQRWERIYLEDGPEGLFVERRGRATKLDNPDKGRKKKQDPKTEEDLIAEVQRLRMENDYLKKLNALARQKELSMQKTKSR